MNNLPKGWEWKKLGEVTECLDSKRVPLNSQEREAKKGSIPYYGANSQVDTINEFIFDEELLLLAEDGGSWGNNQKCTYIIRGKSWVNNHAHVLRMRPHILIKFLEACLNLTDLTKYISGTTRGKLNQKQMNNIEIPVPPLPIQQKIVSILECAENLKQKRERVNEEANNIIQSIFYDMFGDSITNEKEFEVLSGNEIFVLSSGKFNPTKNLDDSYSYPTYGGNGITGQSKEYLIDFDTIVIGRVGAYCGSVYKTTGKIWITDNAIYLKEFLKKVNLDYLLYFFKTQNINKFSTQSGQPKITQKPLENMKIPLPPISLQNQFASIVEKIESIKAKQSEATSEINTLFDALMQKAFKGELVS